MLAPTFPRLRAAASTLILAPGLAVFADAQSTPQPERPTQRPAQRPDPASQPQADDPEPDPPQSPREPATQSKVVVTATRLPSESLDVPADVTVIDARDVDPYDNFLVQSLSHVAGVRVDDRPSDNLFGGFELRGFSTNDTSGSNALILLDGIPQRRLSFGGPYLGMLPFDAVVRQELVRGSMGSLYGRGAIAGALQLFTDPGTRDWRFSGSMLAKSTNDTLRGAVRVSGPLGLGEDATFSLSISAKDTGGYQRDTESVKRDVYFHGRVPIGDADMLTLILGYVSGDEEAASPIPIDADGNRLPGISRDDNLSVPGHNFFDTSEYRAAIKWEHDFDDTLRSEVSLAYWKGDTVLFLGRPSNGPAAGSTVVDRLTSQRFWQEETFFGRIQGQKEVEIGGWLDAAFTFGVVGEYLSWDNRTRNARLSSTTFGQGIPIDIANRSEPDPSTWIFQDFSTRFTDEEQFGGYLRTQWDIDDEVVVHLGGRYDRYERFQENRSSGNRSRLDRDAFSPAAGVLWRMVSGSDTNVHPYVNWGRGFNPVFRAVGTTEIAEVDPEKSESFDVGIKGDAMNGAVEGNIALYQIDRNDVVAFDSGSSTYVNAGRWRSRGIELSGAVRPADDVELYASYTYRKTSVESDPTAPANEGKDVPLVPREIAKAGVRYRPVQELLLDLDAQYVGRSYGNTINTTRLPDYLLVGLSATWRFDEHVSASLFGTNLLDEEYYSSVFRSAAGGAAFEGLPLTVGASVVLTF